LEIADCIIASTINAENAVKYWRNKIGVQSFDIDTEYFRNLRERISKERNELLFDSGRIFSFSDSDDASDPVKITLPILVQLKSGGPAQPIKCAANHPFKKLVGPPQPKSDSD
jgi:hypothetical protein